LEHKTERSDEGATQSMTQGAEPTIQDSIWRREQNPLYKTA